MLRSGEQEMHYEDGSHRWTPPDPAVDQEAWEDQVRAHQRDHTEQLRSRRIARRSI